MEDQIDADLLAHVGHTPLDFMPHRCTACALNEAMTKMIQASVNEEVHRVP